MGTELVELVRQGVTALGGLLVTDAYAGLVRPRLVALFRRHGDPDALPQLETLDQLSTELSAPDDESSPARQETAQDQLRDVVRQLITHDPAIVAALIRLADEQGVNAPNGDVSVAFSDNTFHGPVVAHGSQVITYEGRA